MLMNHSIEKNAQRWSKFIQQSRFKKYAEKPGVNIAIISTTNEKTTETAPIDTPNNTTIKEESTLNWLLSMTFCGRFSSSSSSPDSKKAANKNNVDKENLEQQHVSPPVSSPLTASNSSTTSSGFAPLLNNKSNSSLHRRELQKKASCNSMTSSNHDIVPLKQFLRYSMKRSDRRTFQRRRITQPFQPRYEIEWEKDQWLQLDNTTSQQIEHLHKNGFTKIAIRNDSCLKNHVAYENASEMDILLELTLDSNKKVRNEQQQAILCHQPSRFAVRRTYWWNTSHHVGEAHLPSWVDTDLCCKSVMMNARSVMDTVTNFNSYRRPSMASVAAAAATPPSLRHPDTPALSTRSSVNHLRACSSAYSSIKPLKYSEPTFIKEESTFSIVVI